MNAPVHYDAALEEAKLAARNAAAVKRNRRQRSETLLQNDVYFRIWHELAAARGAGALSRKGRPVRFVLVGDKIQGHLAVEERIPRSLVRAHDSATSRWSMRPMEFTQVQLHFDGWIRTRHA